MAKEKKKAKLAHKSKSAAADEMAASKLVPLTGDHVFVFDGRGRTKCGKVGTGWHYGTKEDVKCGECLGEEVQA